MAAAESPSPPDSAPSSQNASKIRLMDRWTEHSPLTLSPCGRGCPRREASRAGEGFSPRTQTPYPSRTASAPPSPTRGEGKRRQRRGVLMPHARRGRVSRHLEALAGIGDLGAVDFQDREILVHIIPGHAVVSIPRAQQLLQRSATLV